MTRRAAGARPPRADVARNRAALLDAARAVLGEEGAGASLEAIARRADVGIATLYRHFPTRGDLLAAAFEPRLEAYAAAARHAVACPDAWDGLAGYVHAVCAMQAADAAFANLLSLTFPATAPVDRRLRQATAGLANVVTRAQADGKLRADFALEDLVLTLMANAGVVAATKAHAPDAWERFIALLLDGFRAPAASILPPPLNASRLARAIRGIQRTPAPGDQPDR